MVEGALSDAKKEQIKLRATFINNIGIGVMLIGVFTPTMRLLYGDVSPQVSNFWLAASPAACFLFGLILHFVATKTLERLKT